MRARVLVPALALVALLAAAAPAQAKFLDLTGTTTFTPSTQASGFLADNGIAVSPVGAASADAGSFAFPIAGGLGSPQSFNGLLAHKGGLRFSKGERSAVARRFVAVRVNRGAVLLAQVPGLRGGCARLRAALARFHLTGDGGLRRTPGPRKVLRAVRNYCVGGRVIVLARLTNLAREAQVDGALLSADLRLSRESARLLNRLAGSEVAAAGEPLGHAVSNVSVVD